jgi:hypothetical protein
MSSCEWRRGGGTDISFLDEDIGSVLDEVLHHADELELVVDLLDGSLERIALSLPRVREGSGEGRGGS